MRLTAFTDFGLRTLMRLAAEPDRIFTTEEIAKEFVISRNHLTKVVRQLADARYIVTQRGAGGGFRLARPPETITLGEVVRTFEKRYALVECFREDGGGMRSHAPVPPQRALSRRAGGILARTGGHQAR